MFCKNLIKLNKNWHELTNTIQEKQRNPEFLTVTAEKFREFRIPKNFS